VLWLQDQWSQIQGFLDSGGPILLVIAGVTFIMWTFIFDRVWYYKSGLKRDVQTVIDLWEGRGERKSWHARKIRQKLVAEIHEKVNNNIDLIATLVAMCPFFGLLGTVTGMIEVFQVLGYTGGGDAKAMAGGVSRATIPTMAGMVAAISGVFGSTIVARIAERENQLLEDHLTMDH
jgi:biopolymer transport protein ExbB